MREKPRDKERLDHILTACNNIAVGMQQYSFDEIQKNNLLYYGMVKNVEIIGEATYNSFVLKYRHSIVKQHTV